MTVASRFTSLLAVAVVGHVLSAGCRNTNEQIQTDDSAFDHRDEKLRPNGSSKLRVVFINDIPVPAASASAVVSAMMRKVEHPPAAGSSPARSSSSTPVVNLHLEWKTPANWKSVAPSSTMRVRQYEIAVSGDDRPLELAVYYFGPKGAGGVAETFDRWVGAFGPHAENHREQWSQGPLHVYTVRSGGQYEGEVMGGNKMDDQHPKSTWMMLGAYVATPEGPYYFKLLGPERLVRKVQGEFRDVLRSAHFASDGKEKDRADESRPATAPHPTTVSSSSR